MHLKTVLCKSHIQKGPEHNKQKLNKYSTLGISKQTLMNDIRHSDTMQNMLYTKAE